MNNLLDVVIKRAQEFNDFPAYGREVLLSVIRKQKWQGVMIWNGENKPDQQSCQIYLWENDLHEIAISNVLSSLTPHIIIGGTCYAMHYSFTDDNGNRVVIYAPIEHDPRNSGGHPRIHMMAQVLTTGNKYTSEGLNESI